MKLPQFAFEISRLIEPSQRLLLACSGGLDSVVLVDVFARLRERKQLELSIAHIHHGPSTTLARDRARTFVSELARKHELPFFSRESARELKGEADLRDFRKSSLHEILEESGTEKVVLAHHADDLLETRLMRLARGTGPQGLLAMREQTKSSLRPFLRTAKSVLQNYAREQNLEHVEDPSNKDEHYFRNWLRNTWLPQLETKRPGAVNALGRSLDLLSEHISLAPPGLTRLSRLKFHQLSAAEKRQTLAAMAHSSNVRDFTQSRIIEVLKRLERLELSRQKRAEFQVGGLTWVVTPHEIEIS